MSKKTNKRNQTEAELERRIRTPEKDPETEAAVWQQSSPVELADDLQAVEAALSAFTVDSGRRGESMKKRVFRYARTLPMAYRMRFCKLLGIPRSAVTDDIYTPEEQRFYAITGKAAIALLGKDRRRAERTVASCRKRVAPEQRAHFDQLLKTSELLGSIMHP